MLAAVFDRHALLGRELPCQAGLDFSKACPSVQYVCGLAGMVKNLSNMIVSRCCDWKQAMSEVMTARQAGLNFTTTSQFDLVVGLR